VALASIGLAACGGGGGGGGGGSTSASHTTFTGNLAAATALEEPSRDPTGLRTLVASLARLAAAAHAQAADVQVCVEGTSFCTVVADDGTFTLAADVGGTVTLVFTAPDFTARVTLTGIPLGATVRLRNLRCSTVTGTCAPDDFEIEGGAGARNAIDCEHGPMHVVQTGELVINGDGDDCIHTAGQCEVTIEADHLVLQGCASCVDAAGGSAVTLTVGTGGFECHAQADGISAAGNSSVHVSVAGAGDIDVVAGQVALLSSGTASIVIAGDQCHIDGATNAVRTNGNASIDTTGCTAVDLVGGTSHDEGDDGDNGDDGDHGNGHGNGKNDGDGDEDD
jgi:hypothetical protein